MKSIRIYNALKAGSTLSVFLLGCISFANENTPLRYNHDIRPILSEYCLDCHGQDSAARKAELRLDTFEGATASLPSGNKAIVATSPDTSALIARILSNDPEERMPPPDTGKTLSAEAIDTLKRWVAQGAEYEPHWAYIPPTRPAVPSVTSQDWVQNPIDAFILDRLEDEGLTPTPKADRYTLIRRLSFDLTGLPPTIEEADAFVQDQRPDALEWVLDRLLSSPRYGEHMARSWMDLARYADSNGYHIDTKRSMWPYREWVIRAFNQNMPFDQFTIEQLAGDLLPDATIDQKIATGFHRNTLFNEEGGIDQEEFRTKAVVDRVNTTMTVWMGTTMSCAQCHDHKYDPFSQAEFFQLYSFFNNVPELGGGTNQPMAPEVQLAIPATLQAELDGLSSIIAALEAEAPQEKDAKESPRLESLRKELTTKQEDIPTSLVMEEMDTPRETYIHKRGDFLQPGEKVSANVPAIWTALETTDAPLNRMDLARWLVHKNNPLTARVTVNRIWQSIFGVGLVDTVEDFGTRGALPSHPELLDYLAVEFIENGWDVKGLIRLINSSSTYQQHSATGPEAFTRDPKNRLLAHGPRHRHDAEVLRDNALAISGLLVHHVGGPSVFPYQPAGLWKEKALTGYKVGSWPISTGDDLYRRGLYTFRRRSVPYPTFQTFDAPSFEFCTAKRSRTNTPLQALTTMNDPQFVEAARVLGQRVLLEGGDTLDKQLTFALRLCITRPPEAQELRFLAQLYEQQLNAYTQEPEAAQSLIHHGRSTIPKELNPVELAAWTTVANVLLNLDETLTKE